jgi:hypothetical protein
MSRDADATSAARSLISKARSGLGVAQALHVAMELADALEKALDRLALAEGVCEACDKHLERCDLAYIEDAMEDWRAGKGE